MASLTTSTRGLSSHAACCQVAMLLAVVLLPPVAVVHGSSGSAPAEYEGISAVFMFGDSIVDPGNNNHRLTEAKANFPPYGQDFPGGVATGRFSNGLVPGDLLASKLGVKELLPPYLSDNLQQNDLLTGVAFASGGSGYDPLTSTLSTARSSAEQLELFHDYKEKLATLVGEEEMTRVISHAVFFTIMGANDIVNNYFAVPLRRHEYDLDSYMDFLVSSAINFTTTLNDMGAKKIGIAGVPPLGCCFKEVSEGCCGSTVLSAAVFIAYHNACPNANDYIFWDGFHPTERAYNIVVDKLIKQNKKYLV
nr:unnamed protein product [Digitaria exilis]